MSKVIVTGGAGFIGSHLAEGLASRGYQVIIIDNLDTGRLSNIDALLSGQKIEFMRGSITDFPLLKRLFTGADYVFHQAARPSVPRSIRNPRLTHHVNITGTLYVLTAARDAGVKKLVFASSSSVYGDTPTLPKVEDMTPNPKSPYAITKLTGEYYCQVFTQVYGLPTACLRYFNVYGPRQDPDSQYAAVIPIFVKNILAGKPPVIFGDGEQSRDFTFVKDVVKANIMAAERNATGIFNIGSSSKLTINHLVELIIQLTGNSAIKAIYKDARQGDIMHSLADITRAGTFGFRPRYHIEEGLQQIIKFMMGELT